jgi:hypothetical protein
MEFVFAGLVIFAAGYVASVFTWEKLHAVAIGAEEVALKLRARARDLETKVRSLKR